MLLVYTYLLTAGTLSLYSCTLHYMWWTRENKIKFTATHLISLNIITILSIFLFLPFYIFEKTPIKNRIIRSYNQVKDLTEEK